MEVIDVSLILCQRSFNLKGWNWEKEEESQNATLKHESEIWLGNERSWCVFHLFTSHHFHICLDSFVYATKRVRGKRIKECDFKRVLNVGNSNELPPWKSILPSGVGRSNWAVQWDGNYKPTGRTSSEALFVFSPASESVMGRVVPGLEGVHLICLVCL